MKSLIRLLGAMLPLNPEAFPNLSPYSPVFSILVPILEEPSLNLVDQVPGLDEGLGYKVRGVSRLGSGLGRLWDR